MSKIFTVTTLLILVALFAKSQQTEQSTEEEKSKQMAKDKVGRVTGIGGIFFKAQNPKELKEWYSKNLGLNTDQYGVLFEFRNTDDPDTKNYLQWSVFSEKTKYFQPSEKEFMINYRVQNLKQLLAELEKAGIKVIGEVQTYDYGTFAHIIDPEGNKIELWEPIDNDFTENYEGTTTH